MFGKKKTNDVQFYTEARLFFATRADLETLSNAHHASRHFDAACAFASPGQSRLLRFWRVWLQRSPAACLAASLSALVKQ